MGSKSYVSTQTVTSPADLRVQLESLGAGGQFISPAATYASPGAVAGSVGSYSQLTQSFNQPITTTGLTSKEVRDMLMVQQEGAGQAVREVSQLSTEAIKAGQAALQTVSASGQSAIQTLAAAKTGEATDWQKYIPYAAVAVIVIAMARSGRKAA
jgi:hypothetical protein